MFSSIGSLGASALRGFGSIGKMPFVSSLPVVGTALSAAGLGLDAYRSFGSDSGAPALPPIPGMGFVPSKMNYLSPYASRAAPNATIGALQTAHAGELAAFGGKNGKLAPAQAFQMLIQAGMTLGPNYWRTKHIAPPGYVMVRDPMNPANQAAVPKSMAIKAGLWKTHAKPPISVRQWHAIKNAKTAIKHLHKVEKAAHIVTHATHRAPAQKALPFHRKAKK